MKLTRIFFKQEQADDPKYIKSDKFGNGVREEDEENCWRDLAPLEFEDWSELDTLCVNFAKKLSTFTHLDHLQLIILFGPLEVRDKLEAEVVDSIIPVLGLIQVLKNRSTLFNLYTDSHILSLLYPDHTTPYLSVAHLSHQIYLPTSKLTDIPFLSEYIREIDFLELCKLQQLGDFTNLLFTPEKEGIYKVKGEKEYYAVHKRNKQPCISQIPPNLFKIDTTPVVTCSQPPPTPLHVDHKEQNKRQLKKLLLLALRNVGIGQKHPEFKMIWKQLYCGCAFALRKDFPILNIPQQLMLQVINNNLKAFSIVTTP